MNLLDEPLLKTFRGPGCCEYCGRYVGRREAAHVMGKGMGRSRRLDHRLNLVALCGAFEGDNCHYKHHWGAKPTTSDLLAVIAKREKMSVDDVECELYRLRRL